MIIILDGVDSTGKTNIGQALQKALPTFQYFKISHEQDFVVSSDKKIIEASHAFQLHFFSEFAKQVEFNVILDRFYPSEYVYGKLFRSVDEEMIWKYDKKFAELNTKIVILSKKDESLSDELFTNQQLIDIKKGYKEFASKTACKILELSTDSEDLTTQVPAILDFCELGIIA